MDVELEARLGLMSGHHGRPFSEAEHDVDAMSMAGQSESQFSVTEAWGLEDKTLPTGEGASNAKQLVILEKNVMAIIKKFGSAGKYLRHRFASKDDLAAFRHYLYDLSPAEADAVVWDWKADLPVTSEADMGTVIPLKLHINTFSLSEIACVKGEPEHDTIQALLSEYLKDGLVTSGEPVRCSLSAAVQEQRKTMEYIHPAGSRPRYAPRGVSCDEVLQEGAVSYVKGTTRIQLALALCAVAWDSKINLWQARFWL